MPRTFLVKRIGEQLHDGVLDTEFSGTLSADFGVNKDLKDFTRGKWHIIVIFILHEFYAEHEIFGNCIGSITVGKCNEVVWQMKNE